MIYHFHETPIFYETEGQGPVLVLLHGFLESSSMWKEITPQLSGNKTIVTIDLPGHGKSGVLAAIHTMELMAEVVNRLLQSLEIYSANIAGHSMGGYVALAYAEKYPAQVNTLALLNSTTYRDNDDRKVQRERAIHFMKEEKNTIISMAISNLFSENSKLKYPSKIERLKTEALNFPSEGITAAIKGMRDRKDRTHILAKFEGRKMIVCGDQDPIVPLAISTKISEETKTPIKILRGSHMSWMENTDKIVKILHFIE